MSSNISFSSSSSSGSVVALVITCIDFRLIDEAEAYLKGIKLLLNKYDEMIVAGASLGYNTSCNKVQLPAGYLLKSTSNPTLWTKCVDDHIGISSALHSISEIIVIDHLGCGAYKGQFGQLSIYDELKNHVEQLNTFRTAINGKYQKAPYNITSVIPLLMSLDGNVDENPTHWQVDGASTTNLFNLAINGVVNINGQTGGLPIPTTTMVKPLSYELVNYAPTNQIYAKISQDASSGIWSIQNLMSGQGFYSQTGDVGTSYRVRVVGTNAYINLTMTAASNDSTVKFAFSQGSYNSQSGWN